MNLSPRMRSSSDVDDVGAGGDDDVGDQRAGCDAPHAVNDERSAFQLEKLLRRLGTHASAETCGRKNGGNSAHFKRDPPG